MSIQSTPFDRRAFLTGSALALGTGALTLLAGCGNTAPTSTTDTGSTAAPGSAADGGFSFIVGFDQEFPPYGYIADDGSYTGFDLDLAAAVCKIEGWTFTPTPITWDAKDSMLNSGQITCIWNGFTIEGREDDYAFTAPYMENRQVVVVRADSGITSLADLAGKNVVTQADSAALDLLSEDGAQADLAATFGKLETIADYNTAFMMLEQGSYDAIAVDYPVAAFNTADKKSVFSILDEALNSEHFGVGFAKTDEGAKLAATVEADLQKLDADGTVKKLCEKYGDQGVDYVSWCLPKA